MKKILFGSILMLAAISQAHAIGDPVAGESKAMICAACHGATGVSILGAWPNLAGQNARYIAKQSIDIRDGRREVIEMQGIIDMFSDEDIRDIASFYAQQPTAEINEEADAETLERGRILYVAGDLSRGIPACTACHLNHGEGNNPAAFPAVAAQWIDYTVLQMQHFRAGTRTNDPNAMMRRIAEKLSDEDIQAVSLYMRHLSGTNQ